MSAITYTWHHPRGVEALTRETVMALAMDEHVGFSVKRPAFLYVSVRAY